MQRKAAPNLRLSRKIVILEAPAFPPACAAAGAVPPASRFRLDMTFSTNMPRRQLFAVAFTVVLSILSRWITR